MFAICRLNRVQKNLYECKIVRIYISIVKNVMFIVLYLATTTFLTLYM